MEGNPAHWGRSHFRRFGRLGYLCRRVAIGRGRCHRSLKEITRSGEKLSGRVVKVEKTITGELTLLVDRESWSCRQPSGVADFWPLNRLRSSIHSQLRFFDEDVVQFEIPGDIDLNRVLDGSLRLGASGTNLKQIFNQDLPPITPNLTNNLDTAKWHTSRSIGACSETPIPYAN